MIAICDNIGNIFRHQPKDIAMEILHKISSIISRIPKPKQIFYTILEQVRTGILIGTFIKWWKHEELTYLNVGLSVVTVVSITRIRNYFHTHYVERELLIVSNLLPSWQKERFTTFYIRVNLFIVVCICYGLFPVIYYKGEPILTALVVPILVDLYRVFTDDLVLWQITISNRIDIDTSFQIMSIFRLIDVLGIRYLLCDCLRSGELSLQSFKALVQAFPGYIYLPDRDGSTSLFQIACQCTHNSLTVEYMVQLDENLLNNRDDRGNTPLHWASRHGKTNNVRYLLEKQMSLVTVENKDGDLPIHLASDRLNEDTEEWIEVEEDRIEIVWRLLQAYPDCLDCVRGVVSCSNGKDIDKKKNR